MPNVKTPGAGAALRVEPATRLAGTLAPPPDKSISHRAALLAAMCERPVRVRNYLRSADTEATLEAVRALGADVAAKESRDGLDLIVEGVGLRGARRHGGTIDVGNAGTLIRVLPGWLAGQPDGRWTLDGDESIRRRPVDRVVEPLGRMGATIGCHDGRLPPIVVEGSRLHGIRYALPVASAQVKSCLLIAGLLAEGVTTIEERLPSRDHTELMLAAAGASPAVDRQGPAVPATIELEPVERLELEEVAVPGDFSSAAPFAVAATIVPGSELTLPGVGVNPTRTGLLVVMRRMGATLELSDERLQGREPVADLTVRHARLAATEVSPAEVPLLIDELPLVALLGVFAEGRTTVSGAEELRYKESDRIATVVGALRGLGASVEATPDGFTVEGSGGLGGGRMDAAGDHRLAMLGAVAGLASRGGVVVDGFDAVAVSYPAFVRHLAGIRR